MISNNWKSSFESSIKAITVFVILTFAPRSEASEMRYVFVEYQHTLGPYAPNDHLWPSSYGTLFSRGPYDYFIERPDGSAISIMSDIPDTRTTVRSWNSSGQVIGKISHNKYFGSTSYLFENGTMTYLGELTPDVNLEFSAINESGRITGGGSSIAPFIYHNGQYEEIPVPEGFSFGVGMDINESNAVVGYFTKEGKSILEGMAFLYTDGQILDLNAITLGIDGYQIVDPKVIFDDGRIVAGVQKFLSDGMTTGGTVWLRPFDPSIDATPPQVPEPSTIAIWIFGAGAAFLGNRQRVRRILIGS